MKKLIREPLVNLIVAHGNGYGIGKSNTIPWKIKEDVLYFQDVTKREYIKGKKNVLIYGRKTYESMSCQPLKDRVNIVITSKNNIKDVLVNNSLVHAINDAKKMDIGKIFICGGSRIYKEALDNDLVDELYVNHVDIDVDNWDAYFPFNSCNDKQIFHTFFEKKFSCFDEITNKHISVKFTKKAKDTNKCINVNKEEQQYLNILENILVNGHFRKTRNSNTWSIFGNTMTFDLSEDKLPLLTTKKVFFRGIFEELIWFLKGDTNSNHLLEKNVKIWEPNTTRSFLNSVNLNHYEEGDIGNLYGFTWRHFGAKYEGMNKDYTGCGFDQIKYVIDTIKNEPHSRRIMLTSYNPQTAKEGVLFPCHVLAIFNIENDNRLSCMMTMRSNDFCCGNPFNIIQYALLTIFIKEVVNNDPFYKGEKLKLGKLIMNLGDTHVYEDHYTQSIRQILREPYDFPKIKINRKVFDITDFKFDDLELIDYNCYPVIPFKMIA